MDNTAQKSEDNGLAEEDIPCVDEQEEVEIDDSPPPPMPLAIDQECVIRIKSPVTHVVGIAGNRNRKIKGTLMARTGATKADHFVWAKLDESVNIEEPGKPLIDGNRQLAVPQLHEGESYQLLLEYPNRYRIPLNYEPSIVAKRESPEIEKFSAQSWLVPLLPRTHGDKELKAEESLLQSPPTGFIYIFLDGYLWREIGCETDEESGDYSLYEINLDKDWGLSERETHFALEDDSILVPFQVGDPIPTRVQIAYSSVQWSWGQLQALGGMHPKDPRVKDRKQNPGAEAEKLRGERMQALEYHLPWHRHNARVSPHLFTADESSEHLHLPQVILHNPVGVAYSHLAEVGECFKDLLNAHNDLPNQFPHYASAELVHRFVNDSSLWEYKDKSRDYEALYKEIMALPFIRKQHGKKYFPQWGEYHDYLQKSYPGQHERIEQARQDYFAIRRLRLPWNSDDKWAKQDSSSDFVRELRGNLDTKKLYTTLFPQEVKDKIKALDEAREAYFSHLDDRVKLRKVTGEAHTSVAFHAALRDYANLDPDGEKYNYMHLYMLWNTLMFPVHARKTTVSDLYDQMERLAPPLDAEQDVGHAWINKILDDSEHPLHQLIFPLSDKVDSSKAYMELNDLPDVPLDGTGKFRPKDFAKAVAQLEPIEEAGAPQSNHTQKHNQQEDEGSKDYAASAMASTLFGKQQRVIALGQRIIADFFTWMDSCVKDEYGNKRQDIKSKRLNIFVRLGQSSQLEDLKGLRLIEAKKLDKKEFVILGANEVREKQMRERIANDRKSRRQYIKMESKSTPEYKVIYADRGKRIVGSDLLSADAHSIPNLPDVGQKTDFSENWDASTAKGKLSTSAFNELYELDVEVVAVSKKSRWYAAQINAAGSPSKMRGTISAASGTGKVLPWAMLYYEILTLKGLASGDLDDKSKGVQRLARFIAVISFLTTTAEATVAGLELIGKDELAKRISGKSFGKFKWKETVKESGKSVKKSRVANFTVIRTLGIGVSAVTTALSVIDTYESIKRHDHDAATAMGAGALIGVALTTISVGALMNAGWALAVPNPVVWGLIAASILLVILAGYLRDSPIEDWVKNGPYGKWAFSSGYEAWANEPKACLQALVGQLFVPQLTQEVGKDKAGKDCIIVSMKMPVFNLNKDRFEIHTTFEGVDRERMQAPVGGATPTMPQVYYLPQVKQVPYDVEYLTDPNESMLYEVKSYFHYKRTGNWRSRAQLTSDGVTIPTPYKPGVFDSVPSVAPTAIGDDQKTWVIADTLNL